MLSDQTYLSFIQSVPDVVQKIFSCPQVIKILPIFSSKTLEVFLFTCRSLICQALSSVWFGFPTLMTGCARTLWTHSPFPINLLCQKNQASAHVRTCFCSWFDCPYCTETILSYLQQVYRCCYLSNIPDLAILKIVFAYLGPLLSHIFLNELVRFYQKPYWDQTDIEFIDLRRADTSRDYTFLDVTVCSYLFAFSTIL